MATKVHHYNLVLGCQIMFMFSTDVPWEKPICQYNWLLPKESFALVLALALVNNSSFIQTHKHLKSVDNYRKLNKEITEATLMWQRLVTFIRFNSDNKGALMIN